MTTHSSKATPFTAQELFRRVMLVLPALADNQQHPVEEVAANAGVSVDDAITVIQIVMNRISAEPRGTIPETAIDLSDDGTMVEIVSAGHEFRRPLALIPSELRALDLGLAMLALESTAEERNSIAKVRERLTRMAITLDTRDATTIGAALSTAQEETAARRHIVQQCIRDRRVAHITYRSARDGDAAYGRRVHPLGFVWSRGQWYIVAWCERNADVRVFREDRIEAAEALNEPFTPPPEFSLDTVLHHGHVLTGSARDAMRVRYSPIVARFIAEEEGLTAESDGSVVAEYPVYDAQWAVRRALRWAPEAVIESPEGIRELVCEALERVVTLH